MIINANALHIPLADKTVQTCVTSPPYWGLRDYGNGDQLGLEETPEAYVSNMVAVFREVWRVLKDDGTVWLNISDSYAKEPFEKWGIKPKDECDIPHHLKIELKKDGWYCRSTIIWHKPNPMPESVRDRCTKAHEYIFLLSKSARYYYDNEAIREPMTDSSLTRLDQDIDNQTGTTRANGGMKTNGNLKAVGDPKAGRNRRSVWTVTTKPYSGAHFATYPPDLIEPCILAGSAEGDVVLDPFSGSGTTGQVAIKNRRKYAGIELNMEYIALSRKRTTTKVMLPGIGL